tara:strand:- start:118 stop:390 length:273 start_codon:yes stop_codon:yes gene_type:complete
MYPICEVTWKDAWIDFCDLTLEEAKELKAVTRNTVGYLIEFKENEGLIMCTDWYPDESEYINTPMVIPWGMVVKYRILGDTEFNTFDKIN